MLTMISSIAARRIGLLAAALPLLFLSFSTHATPAAEANPYVKPGMWIWYIDSSHGGNMNRIIKRARRSKIKTLYIKSGDGTNVWRQFTKPMVRRFRRAGLNVCGWQYVYGDRPVREARVSAVAKRRGANCFVIDAEAEYEGKYSSADRYIRELRRLVGKKYSLSLSTFPYNHYHPAFPYSVFLGPGAATANLPQVYWKAIGDTVRKSIGTTYQQNQLYRRRVFPIGQTWMDPGDREIQQFRRLSRNYGVNPSWWSWQETRPAQWRSLAKPVRKYPGYRNVRTHPVVALGSRGDQVVWLQQHLIGVGYNLQPTGVFNYKTRRAVRRFQKSRKLEIDGVVGTQTWNRLLRVRPVRVRWSGARSRALRGRISGPVAAGAPVSARLPAVRNEIAGAKKPGREP